jgi:hypothetical protein
MPLFLFSNKWELRCINYLSHGQHAGSTMVKQSMFHALIVVNPPPNVTFNPGSGMPLRCYVCSVCGYIEMYAAGIAEHDTWKVR